MNKLEKPIKGKNLVALVEAFFKKVIKKLNQVHSQDYIESELGDNISATAKYIKIANGQHIETFLKRLINEGLGDANSYVGLKIEVLTNNKVYSGIVEIVQINTNNIVLRPKEAFGESIQMPATVRLYVAPLLTSNSESSIVYNSIVTSKSKYNFILGERNIHKGGDNVWIFGKNNVSRENNHNSLIDGYNNDVDSYGNLVIGDNNKHRSYYGATIGQKIKNFKKYNYLFGEGHDNGNGAQYGTAFGKYSKLEANTLFAIGDGTNENNRHNLFEVKASGEILDKDGNDIRKSSGSQVQSDWNETDNSKPAYIKNKPDIDNYYTKTQTDNKYVYKQNLYDKKVITNSYYFRRTTGFESGQFLGIIMYSQNINEYTYDTVRGGLYCDSNIILYGIATIKNDTDGKNKLVGFNLISKVYNNTTLDRLFVFTYKGYEDINQLFIDYKKETLEEITKPIYSNILDKLYNNNLIVINENDQEQNSWGDMVNSLAYNNDENIYNIGKLYKEINISTTTIDIDGVTKLNIFLIDNTNKTTKLYIKKNNILKGYFAGLRPNTYDEYGIPIYKFENICDIVESSTSDIVIRKSKISFYGYFDQQGLDCYFICFNITEDIIS